MAFYEMLPGAGMPPGLQAGMDSVLNKKFGTSTTYPAAGWPDDVNLLGALEEKTVSGTIAHITDGADGVPIKAWEVEIAPTLTGKSAIECEQTGKNLWEFGDQTVSTTYISLILDTPIPAGTYTVSAILSSTHINADMRFRKEDGSAIIVCNLNAGSPDRTSRTITLTEPAYRIYLYSAQGGTGNTATWKDVQIEAGSTATTYEAYTAPTVSTVNLGRTIYGGTVDVVNGTGSEENTKFTVTADMADSIRYIGSGETAYIQIVKSPASNNRWQDLVCSHFTPANIYSGGTQQGIGCYSTQFYIRDSRFTSKQDFLDFLTEQETLGTPLEICYKLATPIDFTFTPITPTPETALGTNNFWADEGDTSVTYRSQGTVTVYPNAEEASF